MFRELHKVRDEIIDGMFYFSYVCGGEGDNGVDLKLLVEIHQFIKVNPGNSVHVRNDIDMNIRNDA